MDEFGRPVRFRDPGVRLHDLAPDDIDVVCPRCGGRAVVSARPVEGSSVWSWPRRFTCTGCVHSATWPAKERGSRWGEPVDPFFRFPLWLTARCCGGHTLWAFHRAHLTLLEGYVAATLRERSPTDSGLTLVARLPPWMKSAGNRDELLRVIARLRASLDT